MENIEKRALDTMPSILSEEVEIDKELLNEPGKYSFMQLNPAKEDDREEMSKIAALKKDNVLHKIIGGYIDKKTKRRGADPYLPKKVLL